MVELIEKVGFCSQHVFCNMFLMTKCALCMHKWYASLNLSVTQNITFVNIECISAGLKPLPQMYTLIGTIQWARFSIPIVSSA